MTILPPGALRSRIFFACCLGDANRHPAAAKHPSAIPQLLRAVFHVSFGAIMTVRRDHNKTREGSAPGCFICFWNAKRRPAKSGNVRTLRTCSPRTNRPSILGGIGSCLFQSLRIDPNYRGWQYVPVTNSLGMPPHVLSAPARLVNYPHISVRKPHRRVLIVLDTASPRGSGLRNGSASVKRSTLDG